MRARGRSTMRTGRALLVLAPWVVMLGLLMPFTFMVEPEDRWYIEYTSMWFLIALLLAYPAIIAAGWVDSPPGVGTIAVFVVL
jgi:hypothetical protein